MSAEHFPSLVAALSKLVEVLRASAPEVTPSGPPEVIEIHSDDEEEQQEHEFASEISVEHEVRTQTGPSISGEASGEMVNPSSRLPASDSLQVTAVADGGDVQPFTITEAATMPRVRRGEDTPTAEISIRQAREAARTLHRSHAGVPP